MINGFGDLDNVQIMKKRSQLESNYSERDFFELPTGVEPRTFQIPDGRSNH